MDWGEGRVTAVVEVDDEVGAICDSCDADLTYGLAIDIAAQEYGSSGPQSATLCEACFEDLTSDMGIDPIPGATFLILGVPAFTNQG